MKHIVKKIIFSGGFLLVVSAGFSRLLSFLRDRIFLEYFAENNLVDLVFAVLRVSDSFLFLFLGGVVVMVLIPRIAKEKEEDSQIAFFRQFLTRGMFFFGMLCFLGIIFPEFLLLIFSSELLKNNIYEVTTLFRFLFGALFLLCFASFLNGFLNFKERFISLALEPILYVTSVILGTIFLSQRFGIYSIGIGALCGGVLSVVIHIPFFRKREFAILFSQKISVLIQWKGIFKDFLHRFFTNALFQGNQLIDLTIASFLLAGSITSVAIGYSLGMFMLVVFAIPVTNYLFPKVVKKVKKDRFLFVLKGVAGIFLVTIPVSLIGSIFASDIIRFLYNPPAHILNMSTLVLQWVIISLPFINIVPLLARFFYANNNRGIPTLITMVALTIGSVSSAYLALVYWSGENAVLGLAMGTFLANCISGIVYFVLFLWKNRSFLK